MQLRWSFDEIFFRLENCVLYVEISKVPKNFSKNFYCFEYIK